MIKRCLIAAMILPIALFLFTGAGVKSKKYAALTFDDGPAGQITQQLLEGLRERNVRATFFLCCYRMEQYPNPVEQMAEDGHEIGIHGCSHEYFTRLTNEQLQEEIRHTAGNIIGLTGTQPTLLRPPGGLYNQDVRQTVESSGLSMILWSLDPEDWDRTKRGTTANYVVSRIRPGDVVLLHDLSRENVAAALEIIDRLTAQGWTFVTVSRLAELSGTELTPGGIYRSFS